MSDFSFTATAQCELCGNFLDSSDEDCDHDGQRVEQQFFRKIGSGEPQTVGIEATTGWQWHRLAREVGKDWLSYEWLGPRSQVDAMLDGSMWDGVDDLPKRAMSVDAPSGVSEEV